MIKEFKKLSFSKLDEFIPALIIIIVIAVSYRISTGLALGFVSFTLIKVVSGKVGQVKPAMWVIAILSVVFVALDRLGGLVEFLQGLIRPTAS